MMKNLNIADYLNEYLDTDLKFEVFESLENEMQESSTLDDWINFLSDIVSCGLKSGIVKSMFYTESAEKFTLDNFVHIVDLVNELGIDVKMEYQLLTKLADFAYEHTCGEILEILKKQKERLEDDEFVEEIFSEN